MKYLTIPINIYEGKIEIKGKTKINPLHKFVLELAIKESSLESVIKSFNLDQRLVQEAIVDLMYREFVYVDLEKSLIFVSHEIQNYIDRGKLEEYLEEEYPESISLKWVQDTVSGQIMMFDDVHDHFRTPLDLIKDNFDPNKQIQLTKREYIKIQDITPQTLLKVAKMELRNFIHEGDIFDRINRLYDLKLVDSRSIYIQLKEMTLHGQNFEIPSSKTIPFSVLEFWTKSLTKIDAYSISDLSPADEDFLIQFDWNLLMKKWNLILSQIGELFSKSLSKYEKKLRLQRIIQSLQNEVLNKIIPLMIDLCSKVGEVNVIIGKGEEILKSLQSIIDKASNLVIIGSAFISQHGIQTIHHIIESLLSRKVKVVLIWGQLGEPIDGLISNFPIFQNENISIIKSNNPFHSKFLIIDNSYAWITSCNLLSYMYNDKSPEEVICELKYGRIINELLEYARTRLIQNKVILPWIDYYSVPRKEKNEIITRKEILMRSLQEITEELINKCQILLEQPNNDLLLQDLQMEFENIKNILKKLRKIDSAHLIENLEHRRLLRAALLQARRSVRIGTDRINRQAVGPVIVADLNTAFARCVTVQVRWGREEHLAMPKEDLTYFQKVIEELIHETSNNIEIYDKPSQSHAKFLTMDDNLLLITSFNLLAFAGNGLADDDITDELGVVLCSNVETNKIINTFSEPKPIIKQQSNNQLSRNKLYKK